MCSLFLTSLYVVFKNLLMLNPQILVILSYACASFVLCLTPNVDTPIAIELIRVINAIFLKICFIFLLRSPYYVKTEFF